MMQPIDLYIAVDQMLGGKTSHGVADVPENDDYIKYEHPMPFGF